VVPVFPSWADNIRRPPRTTMALLTPPRPSPEPHGTLSQMATPFVSFGTSAPPSSLSIFLFSFFFIFSFFFFFVWYLVNENFFLVCPCSPSVFLIIRYTMTAYCDIAGEIIDLRFGPVVLRGSLPGLNVTNMDPIFGVYSLFNISIGNPDGCLRSTGPYYDYFTFGIYHFLFLFCQPPFWS